MMGYKYSRRDSVSLGELVGLTIDKVVRLPPGSRGGEDDELWFCTNDGVYVMFHYQDCCESVYIEDICGSLSDLVGSPVTSAFEESSKAEEYDEKSCNYTDWTFYKIDTARGGVTIRWCGSSNRYYSTAVSFVKAVPTSGV